MYVFLHSQKDFANKEKEKAITNEDDSKEIEEVSKTVSQKDSRKVCFQQKKEEIIVLDPAKVWYYHSDHVKSGSQHDARRRVALRRD